MLRIRLARLWRRFYVSTIRRLRCLVLLRKHVPAYQVIDGINLRNGERYHDEFHVCMRCGKKWR